MDTRVRKELEDLKKENEELKDNLINLQGKLYNLTRYLKDFFDLISEDKDYSPEDIKDININIPY